MEHNGESSFFASPLILRLDKLGLLCFGFVRQRTAHRPQCRTVYQTSVIRRACSIQGWARYWTSAASISQFQFRRIGLLFCAYFCLLYGLEVFFRFSNLWSVHDIAGGAKADATRESCYCNFAKSWWILTIFFTGGFRSTIIVKIPSHCRYVATLPCDITGTFLSGGCRQFSAISCTQRDA